MYKVNGSVDNAASLTAGEGSATFQDLSFITLDFGKNIAGIISLDIIKVSDSNHFIGVTFSERLVVDIRRRK
jgi:hypothetical protein